MLMVHQVNTARNPRRAAAEFAAVSSWAGPMADGNRANRGRSREQGRDDRMKAVRISGRSDPRRPTLKAAIRARELVLVRTLDHEVDGAGRDGCQTLGQRPWHWSRKAS